MCIKVVRWFACPRAEGIDTPTTETQLPEGTLETGRAYDRWRHGDKIPAAELVSMGLPPLKGWVYARHKQESWVRCALTKGILCQEAVIEVRTELFDRPCSSCTGEDTAVLSTEPNDVIIEGHDAATPAEMENLEKACAAYFEELVPLIRYWMMRLFGVTLSIDRDAQGTLFRSMCCLENPTHVIPDHNRLWPEPLNLLCTECQLNQPPYAGNISRGVRSHEADTVRRQVPLNWYAANSVRTSEICQNLGRFENISWLTIDEKREQHIEEAEQSIDNNVEAFLEGAGGVLTNHFKRAMEQRRTLAKLLAWYPCRDPGLSYKFRQVLLNKYILATLNPKLCPVQPTTYEQLDYHKEGSESLKRLVGEFASANLSAYKPTTLVRRAYLEAIQRRDNLFKTMVSNQEALRHNILEVYRALDSSRDRYEISVSQALEIETSCVICAEDFREHGETPAHFRPIGLPCCSKPIHFGCLKGVMRRSVTCLFCRNDLKESTFPFVSRPVLALPPGVFELPDPDLDYGDWQADWWMDEELYYQTLEDVLQRYGDGVRLRERAAAASVAAGTGQEEESPALVTPDPDAVGLKQEGLTWTGGEVWRGVRASRWAVIGEALWGER